MSTFWLIFPSHTAFTRENWKMQKAFFALFVVGGKSADDLIKKEGKVEKTRGILTFPVKIIS